MINKLSRAAIISLFVAVIFSLMPACGQLSGGVIGAADVHASSVDVGDITYFLNEDDHTASADVYNGSGGAVTIPGQIEYEGQNYTVTEIGSEIFENMTEITSVSLPDTLTMIGELAFYNTGIHKVTIPEGVKTIDYSAFSSCENLTAVTLPSTINDLYGWCFNSPNLKTVTCLVPSTKSVYIEDDVFGTGNVTVKCYAFTDIYNYAVEQGFTVSVQPEPISELKLKTTGDLSPKYGDPVSNPGVNMDNTGGVYNHLVGHITYDVYWCDSNGNQIYGTIETNSVYLRIQINAVDPARYDFSDTIFTLNGITLTTLDWSNTSVVLKYGDVDTGACKITAKAVCKGNNTSGTVSKDNSSFSDEQSIVAASNASATFYAKAEDGTVFLGWRKDDPNASNFVGTNLTLTVPASNSTYYAIFGKSLANSGNLGARAKYVFDPSTGTVTISPLNWESGDSPIIITLSSPTPFNGTQKIKHIIIENGISDLPPALFIDEDAIESISLPATLQYAGSPNMYGLYATAFARCRLLGTGFTVAEDNRFLTAINGSLFGKNESGDAVTMYTYFGRTGVTQFTTPSTITKLCNLCFSDFALEKLVIRGDGLELEDYAIDDGTVGEILIDEGVKKLGDYGSFTGPVSVTLPASLESVGSQNDIIASDSLKSIEVASGNTHLKGIDGVLYKIKSNGELALYKYPVGKDNKSFTTANGATEIQEHAFRYVKTKLKVTLANDMTTVRSGAFRLHNNLTLTVSNPGTTFETNCIDNSGYLVHIRAAEGSTAQQFYQLHQDNPRWSFELTEAPETSLPTPKNFSWDGDTLNWDAVPGANSYKVDVFTRDAKGNESKVTHESRTVSSPSFTYEENAYNRFWYKSSKYWCEVTAYGAEYLPSAKAVSPERAGNMFTVNELHASMTGDTLTVEPYHEAYIENHDSFLFYAFDVYNESDVCVVSQRPFGSNETSMDLRGVAQTYSLPAGKEYRVVVGAYTSLEGHMHVPVSETVTLSWYYGSKDIRDCTFPDSLPDQVFTGEPIVLPVEVYDGATLLTEGTDYKVECRNNVDAGEAEIVISGLGAYGSAKILAFNIIPADFAGAVFDPVTFTYTGSVAAPVPTATFGTYALILNKDFTVDCGSYKNVGKAKMTLTGKGNFVGKQTASFKIVPKGTKLTKINKYRKALTVKWKRQSNKMSKTRITGYQIQLATNPEFTANKKTVTVKGYKNTSKKVKKLKSKKKYYVRVRTYKTISGTKYCSPWSNVMVKTTK